MYNVSDIEPLSYKLAVFSHLFTTQYKQNPEMFKQTARLWSHVYAGAPVSSPEYTRKIDKLCAMGFEKVSISKLFTLPLCTVLLKPCF